MVGNIGATTTLQSDNFKTPITEFMSQNFSTFVTKYNEFHEKDLIATKLLRTRNLILEEDKPGYYFDFDFGYMVASEDYEIYLISNYDLSFEEDLFLTDERLYFKDMGCAYSEAGRFCVLVRYSEFMNNPDKYIDMAYDKLNEPICDEVHWRDLRQ